MGKFLWTVVVMNKKTVCSVAAQMLKRMATDVVSKCTFAMIVANSFRPAFV
jgi:hypothetical protein